MDTVQRLSKAIVIDHYIDNIYSSDDYINFDVTLTTNIGKFIIKSIYYCDMLEPEKLLASYRPGFGEVIKKLLTDKIYGENYESIDFIPT